MWVTCISFKWASVAQTKDSLKMSAPPEVAAKTLFEPLVSVNFLRFSLNLNEHRAYSQSCESFRRDFECTQFNCPDD